MTSGPFARNLTERFRPTANFTRIFLSVTVQTMIKPYRKKLSARCRVFQVGDLLARGKRVVTRSDL